MAFTASIHHSSTTDHVYAGYRAMDLSKVAQARYPVPLSFVIPCSLYDTFLTESGIRERLRGIYSEQEQNREGYTRAFKDILSLFEQVRFSARLKEELLEAYHSLAIPSSGAGASALVEDDEEPSVIIIPSPTYRLPDESLQGVRMNVRGEEPFLDAIKRAWASAFLPEHALARGHYDIDEFSMGLVVEQQGRPQATARGTYRSQEELQLRVRSYLGLLDAQGVIEHDEHRLSADHLQIRERTVRQQQHRLVAGRGGLEQRRLGEEGAKQALNDRQVLEVARLTKRAHVILEQDVTVHCSVDDEEVSIMLVLREREEGLTRHVQESPEPAPAAEEEYVPVESVTLREEPAMEPVAEEASIIIADEEDSVAQEPVRVYEEEPVEAYDEEPLPQEEPVAAEPSERPAAEETLFDMVQQEAPALAASPGAELVREAFVEAEKRFVEVHGQRFDHEPADYDSLVRELREAAALPLEEEDLRSLESWHERVEQGEEPSDAAIGLSWRVLRVLRR